MQMVKLYGLCGNSSADYRRGMRLCLFQPEIAGNVGAVMRLGACMGVAIDLIEPMGFAWDDKRVRRTAMDYVDHVDVTRHSSFDEFRGANPGRLILFSTKGTASPYEFSFQPDDILLFGKESGGVPPEVAAAADAVLRIPIRAEVRSFNLATSAALVLGEALRQTKLLPATRI
jgi:tRNA (cytidine/uridine-2'-O-)-methyltransferase